jgi:NAD(P)H-dependent FMN reductase
MTSTLLLVSGSRRAESLNARLLRELGRRVGERSALDVLHPAEVSLPIFDQDLEADPAVVEHVATLHRRFEASDALLIASPEYNGQLPAYLKNLVDWVSRLPYVDPRFENPFLNRPVLLCGASTGWSGGAVAIPHARALFGYVGCLVIGETVCVPYADQAWTGDGFAFDPIFDAHIDAAIDRTVDLAAAHSKARPSRTTEA